jgi:hypothetical protein
MRFLTSLGTGDETVIGPKKKNTNTRQGLGYYGATTTMMESKKERRNKKRHIRLRFVDVRSRRPRRQFGLTKPGGVETKHPIHFPIPIPDGFVPEHYLFHN